MQSTYYLRTRESESLRQIASEVTDFTNLSELIYEMYNTMTMYGGIGIAAPQIGDSRRVLLVCGKEFVNPVIVKSKGYIPSLESCLSFPGRIGFKLRRYSIDVEYQDRYGNAQNGHYVGRNSIILQHEMDHLNGISIAGKF